MSALINNPAPLVIFDLDNCLANDEWRIKDIDWAHPDVEQRWTPYHEGCAKDAPGNVDMLRAAVMLHMAPVFVTMRPEAYRLRTLTWMEQHFPWLGRVDIIMRKPGDKRSSVSLKRDAIQMLPRLPVLAFDDRLEIVEMYQQQGIYARQLAIHTTDAYTKPDGRQWPFDERPEEDGMPLAPPSRGVGFPFTTDPHQAFARATGKPEEPPKRPKNASDYLTEARALYLERNAAYGAGYKEFGRIAAALFPKGLTVCNPDEWSRLAVFIFMLAKMDRYAKNMTQEPFQGHADSAMDLMPYAAMLREMTP